jgi:hypothetical protein
MIWRIVAAGVAVRLGLLLIVDPSANLFGGDSAYYAAGHLDGFRAPLYVLFLKATLPVSWWFPLAVQSALTIFSGVAAYLVFRNLSGLLIATCPFLALFDFRLLSESLYINLLWLGWLLLCRKKGVGSGVLIGLSILTRDTLLLLPLFALILRSRKAAYMAAVAYLIALPWFLIVPSHGRMGLNLWVGTWERNGDWYLSGVNKPRFPAYAFRSPAEERAVRMNWNADEALKNIAVQRIKADPIGTVATWALRYPRLWIGTRSDNIAFRFRGPLWVAFKVAFWGLNLLIIGLGLWGLPRTLAPPVLYAALIYIPFHNVETRYSLFAFPFLLAGVARLRGNRLNDGEVDDRSLGQGSGRNVLDRDRETHASGYSSHSGAIGVGGSATGD